VAKTVFQLPQAVADHGDEPQEGDAGKWHQVQSAKEGLRMVDDLRGRTQRVGRNRIPDQQLASNE
jgi:hypothetical protein